MATPDQDQVRTLLDVLREPIVSAIYGAWSDWCESPYKSTWRYNRSRATFVWEQIIHRVLENFAAHPDVSAREEHETLKFLVQDRVLFRFKKADEEGYSSNILTQLELTFRDQAQELPGIPGVQRVEVVYKLDADGEQIADICVVARDNDTILWEYSLLKTEAAQTPPPIPESDQAEVEAEPTEMPGRPREEDS